jgi:hypothetical protein
MSIANAPSDVATRIAGLELNGLEPLITPVQAGLLSNAPHLYPTDFSRPRLLQIKRGVYSCVYAQEETADDRCHNAFGRSGTLKDRAISEIASNRNERHRSWITIDLRQECT